MGYLNSNTISVEAILTKKGREILSNNGTFNIVKFALADDEIDYRLWNESHPQGSDQYGAAIENLPLLEATPDETQIMRYKLITLPKTTTRIPLLSVGFTSITLNAEGDTVTIVPQTRFTQEDALGYTITLHNSNYAFLEVLARTEQTDRNTTVARFLTEQELNQSITVVGKTFKLIAKDVSPYTASSVTTNITIVGNQTGATLTIPVTIYKEGVPTSTNNTAS